MSIAVCIRRYYTLHVEQSIIDDGYVYKFA